MPLRVVGPVVALCLVLAGAAAEPADAPPTDLPPSNAPPSDTRSPRGPRAAATAPSPGRDAPGRDARRQAPDPQRLNEALRRAGLRVERDIPYAGTDDPRQRLDLYLPVAQDGAATRPARLPVILFIHGGGWSGGDKSAAAVQLLPVLRGGRYAGVSVGYRLTGQAQWPAQGHDVKAAVRFVRANADRFGLDPDRIAVMGRSAGGHLALFLGTSGDLPALEGDVGDHDAVSSRVTCVVNFFGVADLASISRQPSQIDRTAGRDFPESRLLGGSPEQRRAAALDASPLTHVTPDDAPTLTIHGDRDPTVPYAQGVLIHDALKAAGVESYLVTIRGGGHGDFGAQGVDRVEAFLAKHLLGEPATVSEAPIDHAADPDAPRRRRR